VNYTTLMKKFDTREKKAEPFSGLKLFHFYRYESRKIGPGGTVVVNLGSGSEAKRQSVLQASNSGHKDYE